MTTPTPGDDGYEISTDTARLDVPLIHHWLSTDAYWAHGRDLATVERSVRGSLNFGLYAPSGPQVGYARVVTDHVTFAWLCDVYVAREHRGRGLGGRLVAAVKDTLEPLGLTRMLLMTRDAHAFYARAGFTAPPDPGRLMLHTFPA
ncbi:GNAT family N-acetyltransferase [Streptomyces sp. RFCAC02]|uniref:GNAT family N-acetyltransferase n=1 Tax=Streptomyces sp. RFCAC02 TaxID=2499143 RepID=UPI00102168A6|nr:GNAT family N-acetyltransferase [Streptomyces sp. RFCAC02]